MGELLRRVRVTGTTRREKYSPPCLGECDVLCLFSQVRGLPLPRNQTKKPTFAFPPNVAVHTSYVVCSIDFLATAVDYYTSLLHSKQKTNSYVLEKRGKDNVSWETYNYKFSFVKK